MRILLDSHVFVWFVLGDRRCKKTVRDIIERPDVHAHVSAVTAWELATKVRIGKWPEAEAIVRDLVQIVAAHDFRPLPATLQHGRIAGLFASAHKDPFDRMLAAQSEADDMPLVSADPVFQTFGIQVIW